MKKSTRILLLSTFVLGLASSCQNAADESVATEESAVVKKEVLAENKASVDMKVDGMVCAMGCAKFIQDKVAELDGIVLSEVDYENKSAHFEFDKTTTSAEDIEKYINGIHDGQYSASIAGDEQIEEVEVEETTEEVEGENAKKAVGAVSKSLDFAFPELFTYFLRRI